jgi:hypothetical protein
VAEVDVKGGQAVAVHWDHLNEEVDSETVVSHLDVWVVGGKGSVPKPRHG